MTAVPILIQSDAPELTTGLARITRHLADVLTRLPEFRVGTFGRGGWGSAKLPWPQYRWPEAASPQNTWGQDLFQPVCENFFGAGGGILFTIMDPSRINWLTRPQYLRESRLRTFLEKRNFKIWSYLPVDALGPNGKLSSICADAVAGVDRPLAYGMFGAQVLTNTLGREVEWLPHGINMDVFQPRDSLGTRMGYGIRADALVIGMNATNQTRKDWGVAAAAMMLLRRTHPNLVWLIHTDMVARYWDLRALITDHGLEECVYMMEDTQHSDIEMSYIYSMCDVTMLATLGEGTGYPVIESLACGRPCITTDYAGSVELTPRVSWLVPPVAMRLDGYYNQLRPVTRPEDWVAAIERVLEERPTIEECRESVTHLDWKNLYITWNKWFLEGLK